MRPQITIEKQLAGGKEKQVATDSQAILRHIVLIISIFIIQKGHKVDGHASLKTPKESKKISSNTRIKTLYMAQQHGQDKACEIFHMAKRPNWMNI